MESVDWARINELRADIGDEDFADVAILFVSELTEHLEGLSADPGAAKAADFHFLRGSAANLGFRALVEACREAEAVCDSGGAADISAVRAAFDAALAEVAPKMPELVGAA